MDRSQNLRRKAVEHLLDDDQINNMRRISSTESFRSATDLIVRLCIRIVLITGSLFTRTTTLVRRQSRSTNLPSKDPSDGCWLGVSLRQLSSTSGLLGLASYDCEWYFFNTRWTVDSGQWVLDWKPIICFQVMAVSRLVSHLPFLFAMTLSSHQHRNNRSWYPVPRKLGLSQASRMT